LVQVIKGEILRRARAHVKFADAKIDASGAGLYGG